MTTPATRLITLIMLLQRQPNQKAEDLAEKLGVSVRTLHRYFGKLEQMGIPIYAERGPHGGFSLVRGYQLPPLIFTPEEATALYLGTSLAREMWGELYRVPAEGAMAKLDNVLPDDQRAEVAWARRSLVATGMHRTDPREMAPTLKLIKRGAHEERQLAMTYRSGTKGERTEREVDPFALIHRSGRWYLVGHCHLRRALRTFRVDRIERCALLSREFEMPPDFDLDSYLGGEFTDQTAVQARLHFVPEAAGIARANLSNWDSLEERPDGSLEVVLSAPDLHWMASMVLSFATWVTVEEPPELRAIVRDWAAATAAQYKPQAIEGAEET